MKAKASKNSLTLTPLLFALSLLLVTCKKDPCKDVVCQNGGTAVSAGKTCTCDCPPGYEGEFCETKSDFVTCKINGVNYQSVQIIIDTITGNSILYKRITTAGSASQSEIIVLNFKAALLVGTYQASYLSGMDFLGTYIKNQAIEYYSTSGFLTLTNVSDRYEGNFNFTAKDDPTTQSDSVMVTDGSFSIKK